MKTGIHIFEKTIRNIKEKTNPTVFSVWFKGLEFRSFENDTLEIAVPSKFFKEFFINHYQKFFLEEFARAQGSPTIPTLKLTEIEEHPSKRQSKAAITAEPVYTSHPSLNHRYTFERFVVGKSNELAYYAARSVAENPSSKYNPLVIFGKSGLGKTHLLNAVGHLFFQRFREMNLVYTSSEQLMNEFIYCTRNDSMARFREKYRKDCDLLLLDDIQFIGGNKEATQEEIFNIINTLLEKKRQIVIVSSVHPSRIERLDEKLLSRITWGLTCEIKAPELPVRIEILREKARLMGLKLSDEIIDFIASSIKSNVRELESSLNHIEAFSNLTKHEINMALVKESLKDFIRVEKNRINKDKIVEAVSNYYNIDRKDILSSRKVKNIVNARHISIYLIRKHLNTSLSEIGEFFGGKNHSVILFSIKKVEKYIKEDETVKNDIASIENILSSL